ncbi:MAG: transglycosylase domain-containing protein [Eubacteriales bacterium]|nr:transglycosylase domain-containing protein [Eubacteriales bacterium]
MNYGKKSVHRKKKALQSTSRRLGHKCLLTFTKVLLLFVLAAGIIGMCAGLGVFKGIIDSAPTITLEDATPTRYSSFIYDSEGNQIAKLIAEDSNRVPVTMDQIPQDLGDAFVAIEDERFYQHNGIDIMGILRAGVTAIRTGFQRQEGASTITQQLIKNTVLTTWTQEKTLGERVKRKIQEQYLAIELEKDTNDKSKILEQYMNTINLGQNTLGVQAASKRYFNKNVWDLSLSECAAIAAITQNPSKYNPLTHPENNEERRGKVLNNMLEQGYITQTEYDQAVADTSDLYDRIQTANLEVGGDSSVDSFYADAVKEAVTEDLIAAGYTETQAYVMVYSGGLSIYSAMDPTIQAICDEVASNEEIYPEGTRWLLSYQLTYKDPDSDEEGGIVNVSSEMFRTYYQENGNKSFNLLYDSQEEANQAIEAYKAATLPEGASVIGESISLTPQPQISLVVEDQSTGYVVAMVGGRGTKEGNLTLNRATDTVRQPGSTFKIVSTYAPALDSAGMTLADVEVDGPFNYDSGKPVSNWYSSGYRGICSLRDGIRDSLNIVTVKVLTQITPRLGYEYLQKFGFTTLVDGVEKNGKVYSDVNQPLALGGITNGVKNIELNAAYAAIANGGQYIKPKLYTMVKDHDGNVILDNTSTQGTQVIKPSTAFLLTSAMTDVVTSGTGTAVNFGGMNIAGKTGTTSDYNDIWFSGYTPYYTCTTWTGYDNNTKLRQGAERSLAKKLWREVMSRVHENLENKAFQQPADIVAQTVCSKSGKLPTALCQGTLKTEYFAADTVPTETCDVHYQGKVCAYSGLPATAVCPFAVDGTLEMLPENERILTGQTTTEGTQQTCPHTAEFMATPGAEEVIEQQRLEMQLKNNAASYETMLASLQQQLQTATADKANADARLAAATDDSSRAEAQNASNEAQNRINSINAQINQLNAAQTAAQTAAPAAAQGGQGAADDGGEG